MPAIALYFESSMHKVGMSTSEITQALFMVPVVYGTITFLSGFIADKLGRKVTVTGFSVTCILGYTLFVVGILSGWNPYLIGFFAGLYQGSYWIGRDYMNVMMTEKVPTDIRASVVGAEGLLVIIGLAVYCLTEYVVESIEKHNELNSKLWDLETKELRPEVKETINNIANEYVDLLNENDIKIKLLDTLLVGSNASYNYTENSDLDLHLIADTSVVDCPKEILSKLYDAYKSIFNDKYNINIRKINVEVYVEPDKTQAESNGIYSLKDG